MEGNPQAQEWGREEQNEGKGEKPVGGRHWEVYHHGQLGLNPSGDGGNGESIEDSNSISILVEDVS